MSEQITDCSHSSCSSLMAKLKMIDVSPIECRDCGERVSINNAWINMANILLVISVFLAIGLSITYRSYTPYLLILAFYVLTRSVLLAKSPLSEVEQPKNQSALMFAILAIVVWLLSRYFY